MSRPVHQTVDLRTGVGSVVCGDEETARELEERRERARAAQRVPYAVAPCATVRLADGTTLEAGAEVTAAMLEGFYEPAPPYAAARPQPIPGWRVLENLVRRGDVLEREDARAKLERQGA